ncbi:unnamed protein product [Rotaria sp. Silwood2]|nr:unnamed protein product [Rotaria sp. Silwood2]
MKAENMSRTSLECITSVIHWSTHIHSDSAVAIIQQVFDNKKAFTIWEKDDLVFGHYIVHYFTHGCEFSLKEKHIYPILQDDISFESQISVMNFDNLQTNYRKELEQFLDDKKHEQQQRKQFLIIYSKHPLQTEMKIRFFGEKTLVKNSARELRNLMSKHQIKVVNIGLDFERSSYIMNHCLHQLRNVELEYKDDNVRINIRQNSFDAPQYLTRKIEHLIHELAFQATMIVFQCLDNAHTLITDQKSQLTMIAQRYNCQIDFIDVKVQNEIITLPKSINSSTIELTPKYLIEQSNQFYSSIGILKKISISNFEIEIHRTENNQLPKVSIISSLSYLSFFPRTTILDRYSNYFSG